MKRIAAILLVLSACDGGTADEPTPTRSVKASSPMVDKLKTLSELNRGLALRRAIQDAGNNCKRIEASGYQQDYKNLSMWTARCSEKRVWAVFIAPNGDVQVRACTEAQQLGLPACRMQPA
jgi:hypothetical protein